MEFNKVYWLLGFYRKVVPIFNVNISIIEHAESDISS